MLQAFSAEGHERGWHTALESTSSPRPLHELPGGRGRPRAKPRGQRRQEVPATSALAVPWRRLLVITTRRETGQGNPQGEEVNSAMAVSASSAPAVVLVSRQLASRPGRDKRGERHASAAEDVAGAGGPSVAVSSVRRRHAQSTRDPEKDDASGSLVSGRLRTTCAHQSRHPSLSAYLLS